jgi:site-specific recombinase XerD
MMTTSPFTATLWPRIPMELLIASTDSVISQVEVLVGHAVPSAESRRAYQRAIRELISWCQANQHATLSKAVVYAYRSELLTRHFAPATINQKLSAIRRLATELADAGSLPAPTAAAIARVKGVKQCGIRLGRWLSRDEAQALLDLPDATTLRGKRDRSILALAIGCGLRRKEVAQLDMQCIQEREGRWILVNIRGKHGRVRSVPMANWCKHVVDAWTSAAEITSGRVFRHIDKTGRLRGSSISAQAVYEIIRGYGVDLGTGITPHDLRRSFAQLAHKGHAPLEQIQLSLGHASIATTERYIGVRQNLVNAPCDVLGLADHSSELAAGSECFAGG